MTAAVALPSRRRPVLGGLPWVTWRQHRVALLGVVGLFGALSVLLVVNGLSVHHAYAQLGLSSCGNLNGPQCQLPLDLFEQRYQSVAMYLPRFFEWIPGVLGVFVGAPLVARELESGTHCFAWTQGRNRTQWIVTKVLLLGAVLTALAAGFSVVFSWWFGPWLPIMGRMDSGQAYEIVGVVFAARTLFGFALGALLGTVIRRTVPAMAATAAGWLLVVWPSVAYLRPLLQAPVKVLASSNLITNGGWVIQSWNQDAAGHHVGQSALVRLFYQTGGGAHPASFDTWLADHGYTQWASFQPNTRFWHFQTVEGLAYVGLAVVLGLATIWLVRRRVT